MRSFPHYNVAPRFTCGSPAQVDRETAERVAREEVEFHAIALSGAFGPEKQKRAEQPGALMGIAEARIERRNGWDVTDLCTGEGFFRPFSYPAKRSRR